MRCICHSLALAASYASKKMPPYLEELLRRIYCYLCYSSKRQQALGELQKLLNLPEHKLLKLSTTRWLSFEAVINRTLEQYPALLTYFEKETRSGKPEDTANQIYKELKNPWTNIYLEFLSYILKLVNKRNLEFQSEESKVHLLYTKMETLFKSTVEIYIDENYVDTHDAEFIEFQSPTDKWLPLDRIDIGPTAKAELNSLTNCKPEDKRAFRKQCRDFLVELASQIDKRFPFKDRQVKMLRDLQFIEPCNLKHVKDITEVAHVFGFDVTDVHTEYKLLQKTFQRDPETDIKKFWLKVQEYCDEQGQPQFPLCLAIVKRILLLPHSSANCERIFSAVVLNKTKTRNKLNTESLNGILNGKSLLKGKKSILDIEYNEMLTLFTKYMYT